MSNNHEVEILLMIMYELYPVISLFIRFHLI